MSRYDFTEIVSNCNTILDQCDRDFEEILEKLGDESNDVPDSNEPKDIKGYSLYDWSQRGEIGWDPPMQTFFIQLIFRAGEEDQHGWWIGTEYGEIPNFPSLCNVIDQIFNMPRGFFEYTDCIERS